MIISVLTLFYTTLLGNSCLTFFVGSIWIFKSFIEDITKDPSFLNIGGISNRSQNISKKRFCNIIKRYSDVKQLSENLNNCQWFPQKYTINKNIFQTFRLVHKFNVIYEFAIFGGFSCTILNICRLST